VGDPTGQALLPVEEMPPGEQALGEATQFPVEGNITGRLTIAGELIMGRHMTGLIPVSAAAAAPCCCC